MQSGVDLRTLPPDSVLTIESYTGWIGRTVWQLKLVEPASQHYLVQLGAYHTDPELPPVPPDSRLKLRRVRAFGEQESLLQVTYDCAMDFDYWPEGGLSQTVTIPVIYMRGAGRVLVDRRVLFQLKLDTDSSVSRTLLARLQRRGSAAQIEHAGVDWSLAGRNTGVVKGVARVCPATDPEPNWDDIPIAELTAMDTTLLEDAPAAGVYGSRSLGGSVHKHASGHLSRGESGVTARDIFETTIVLGGPDYRSLTHYRRRLLLGDVEPNPSGEFD